MVIIRNLNLISVQSWTYLFNLVRTNFSEWLRTWRMTIPFAYEFKADVMKFAQKTYAKFKVVKYAIQNLKSVKMQFALNVREMAKNKKWNNISDRETQQF